MPEAAVIALVEFVTAGELILTAAEAAVIVTAVAVVSTTVVSRDAQRKAQHQARDAWNASLTDRYLMTRGAKEARQIVLGRTRVSGPMFYVGSYGSAREHLVYTVALAAHELDAIEEVYFDDMPVTLDGSGNVLGVTLKETFSISSTGGTFTINSPAVAGTVVAQAVYGSTVVSLGVSVVGTSITVSGATGAAGLCEIRYRPDPSPFAPAPPISVKDVVSLNGSGNGSVVLAHTPVGPVYITDGDTNQMTDLSAFGSMAGNTLTVTGSVIPDINASVQYQYTDTTFKARVRKYLGAPGQAADAGMIAALPGIWTSAHTATGVAYLVIELDYDPTAFPSGLPNVSALVRGAKVYDPRTGSTAWSDNLALMTRYYALSPLGGRMAAGLVDDASIITAANVCDTSTNYVVNGQTYTRALYRGGIVAKTTARPQDVINDLVQGMAGKWCFVDGALRVKAGSYATPVPLTLDEGWLHDGQQVHVQRQRSRSDVVNVVTASYADETQNYQAVQMPRIAPAAYITEDGAELPLDMALPAVQFNGQAQHVVGCFLRDARAAITLTVLCNMKAYPVEVFDVLPVTLSRFGWVGKTFEVQDVSWTFSGGIQLVLKETDATVMAVDAAFSAFDPAKATRLPSPFKVQDIAGLAVVSGSTAMKSNSDGTVTQRMLASWTAVTDPGILEPSGGIEVRYGLATQPESAWVSEFTSGNQSSVYLKNAWFDRIYLVKARGYNAIASGKWCAPVLHKVGGVSIVIDTPQIADNAVTDFGSSFPADGSHTTLSYSGAPTTNYTDIASLSFTNSNSVNAEVEVFASAMWTVTGSPSSWAVGLMFKGTNDAADISDTSRTGYSAATTADQQFMTTRTFTVAPGKTLVMKLTNAQTTVSGTGTTSMVLHYYKPNLKYNVLWK